MHCRLTFHVLCTSFKYHGTGFGNSTSRPRPLSMLRPVCRFNLLFNTVKTRHKETRLLKSGCPVSYKWTKENLTGCTVSYKYLKNYQFYMLNFVKFKKIHCSAWLGDWNQDSQSHKLESEKNPDVEPSPGCIAYIISLYTHLFFNIKNYKFESNFRFFLEKKNTKKMYFLYLQGVPK